MNPMGALDDVSPHMADNERNVKMGSDGMRGGYNSQPIPPDYYYEDSQEGRFHAPQHPHDSESSHHHQQAGHAAHPAQGEQESIADGASPIKMKDPQNSKHKFSTSLEAKLEADISTSPKRKTSGDVNEDSHGNVTVTTTPDTEATNSLHGHNSHLKKTHKEDLEEANFSEMIEEEPGRPSGAILSLALGLCITGIMVVLIGCRLRVVRRRLRRGGKSPYAHDADYLVNGMYL
ncbi:hypothetical protein C0J52_05001 [Blattella germanica]|nr:hypothetical protein C0J52_05001 [Blattella germanica]